LVPLLLQLFYASLWYLRALDHPQFPSTSEAHPSLIRLHALFPSDLKAPFQKRPLNSQDDIGILALLLHSSAMKKTFRPTWEGRLPLLLCTGLVMLVAVVFGRTLGFEFVNYDDNMYITENPVVQKGVTLSGLKWALTYGEIGHWHPLTWVSHMADYQLYGLQPWGHHLGNVLLHAATTVIFFLVLRKMTGSTWRSVTVAALWSIHPLRVESVAWISERKDVLGGTFFMLTLAAYLGFVRHPSNSRYALVVILFALGLLSKNMLVTLPFVLLLLDYWPLQRLNWKENSSALPRIREKIPLFLLSLLSCVATFTFSTEKLSTHYQLPLWYRIENGVISIGFYLQKSFWSQDLSLHYAYQHTAEGYPLREICVITVLLIVVSSFALLFYRRMPWLFTGWFWFLGMLLPTIGLIQISTYAMADRYTYLPQAGLWIAIVWTVGSFGIALPRTRLLLGSLAIITITSYSALALNQASFWINSLKLWTHAVTCNPKSVVAQIHLGNALLGSGRSDEAAAAFKKAIAINASRSQMHGDFSNSLSLFAQVTFANYLLTTDQLDKALDAFKVAMQINPDSVSANNGYGACLLKLGETNGALSAFKNAIELGSSNDESNSSNSDSQMGAAHNNLGTILLDRGDVLGAIEEFRQAITCWPDAPKPHFHLTEALVQQGQFAEVISEQLRYLKTIPDDPESLNNLAGALMVTGKPSEAAPIFERLLALQPSNVKAQNNYGLLLQANGRWVEAITHFSKTVELKPHDLDYVNNLAWVLATCPDPSLRDPLRAILLAGQAMSESGGNNPSFLRTLAAAYAAKGDYPNAQKNAAKALSLSQSQSNHPLTEALQDDLQHYQLGEVIQIKP